MEQPLPQRRRSWGWLGILAAGEAVLLVVMERRFGTASLLWSVLAGGILLGWLLATRPRG